VRRRVPWLLLLAAAGGALAALPPSSVTLTLAPDDVTVGDRIEARLTLLLPTGARLLTDELGPRLGAFEVLEQGWNESVDASGGGTTRWTWSADLACFRPGEHELPPLRLEYRAAGAAPIALETRPRRLTVRSVLQPGEVADGRIPELADNRPQVGLIPDYSGLRHAAGLLALLLVLAALFYLLWRRHLARRAPARSSDSDFRRTPPHLWALEELRRISERRLLERGELDRYFEELARVIKLYLGGRYRVDLLERTSGELPEVLAQARAPGEAIAETSSLLALADCVKFAAERPSVVLCRETMDAARRIVEQTRPEEPAPASLERGAA
jgi:hypothetical protein